MTMSAPVRFDANSATLSTMAETVSLFAL